MYSVPHIESDLCTGKWMVKSFENNTEELWQHNFKYVRDMTLVFLRNRRLFLEAVV